MDPWTQVLYQIWYYLESGPRSDPIIHAFPAANRYHYGSSPSEPVPPVGAADAVLVVDQSGGSIDLEYSPMYLKAVEDFQITVWSGSMALSRINELRIKVLAALEAGLPDLGLATILDVKLRTGRVSPSLDKAERDADGRLMQWRRDLQKSRQRAVLLELTVTFLISRESLNTP